MSNARRIVDGMTHFVTRRCVGRHFYLKPCSAVNQIILYAFAWAVAQHGMTPHALVAMSNHLHYLLTDPHGRLPLFMRDFHRMVAAAVKKVWKIDETVFADTNASVVTVFGERGAVEKALYTVMNPVNAGLVARAELWPGVCWRPGTRQITVKKPSVWFTGPQWPDELTVTFSAPPAWSGTEDEWHAMLGESVEAQEKSLEQGRTETRSSAMGAQRVLKQRHTDAPKTKSVREPKRNPTIATGGDGPLMRAEMAALKIWRRARHEALDHWQRDKSVMFPRGTWLHVVMHGALAA